MSTTIFLRFSDRDAARTAFALYGSGTVEGPDGAPYWPSKGDFAGHRYDLVVVNGDGAIWQPTDETSEGPDGPEPVYAPIPGFHVNVLWHGPEALIPDFGAARVFPTTPACVFA